MILEVLFRQFETSSLPDELCKGLFPEKMVRSQRYKKVDELLDSRQGQEPTSRVEAMMLN
jgi:hypothetical protein